MVSVDHVAQQHKGLGSCAGCLIESLTNCIACNSTCSTSIQRIIVASALIDNYHKELLLGKYSQSI